MGFLSILDLSKMDVLFAYKLPLSMQLNYFSQFNLIKRKKERKNMGWEDSFVMLALEALYFRQI